MLVFQHHFSMLDLKTADWHGYNQASNVKKILQQISGKIRINFRKFSAGNFRTHNPIDDAIDDGCHNDDVIQLGPLRSQSLFQFVQISDAYFLHLLLRYSHTLWSTGLKSGEFRGHSCGGINSGVSFCINSMVACAQWAFQVLQGSVETVFRWGGKRLIIL